MAEAAPNYEQKGAEFQAEVSKTVEQIDPNLENKDAATVDNEAKGKIDRALKDYTAKYVTSTTLDSAGMLARANFENKINDAAGKAKQQIDANQDRYEKKHKGYEDLTKAKLDITGNAQPEFDKIQIRMTALKAEQPVDFSTLEHDQVLSKIDERNKLRDDAVAWKGKYEELQKTLNGVKAIGDATLTQAAEAQLQHVDAVLKALPDKTTEVEKKITETQDQYKVFMEQKIKEEEQKLADLREVSGTAAQNLANAKAKLTPGAQVDPALQKKANDAYQAFRDQEAYVNGMKGDAKNFKPYVYEQPKPIEPPPVELKDYDKAAFLTAITPEEKGQLQTARDKWQKSRTETDWNAYLDGVATAAAAHGMKAPARDAMPELQNFDANAFNASLTPDEKAQVDASRDKWQKSGSQADWDAYLDLGTALAAQHDFKGPPRVAMPPKEGPTAVASL